MLHPNSPPHIHVLSSIMQFTTTLKNPLLQNGLLTLTAKPCWLLLTECLTALMFCLWCVADSSSNNPWALSWTFVYDAISRNKDHNVPCTLCCWEPSWPDLRLLGKGLQRDVAALSRSECKHCWRTHLEKTHKTNKWVQQSKVSLTICTNHTHTYGRWIHTQYTLWHIQHTLV